MHLLFPRFPSTTNRHQLLRYFFPRQSSHSRVAPRSSIVRSKFSGVLALRLELISSLQSDCKETQLSLTILIFPLVACGVPWLALASWQRRDCRDVLHQRP